MRKTLNMTYASSLTDLCERNSSFDTGVLRVAYTGLNRNGSFISKEAFERNIHTMYNCPIVCNYDRDADSLGGHDMELVMTDDGDMKIVNLTTPVGCIPESAKHWWAMVTEEDGAEHEYLYVEVLPWKRQEAYEKIKEDGITAHSMELTVKDGSVVDGVFHITDFEFTAFALIGVEPCFESSALEMFGLSNFQDRMAEMMQDYKKCFKKISTPSGGEDNGPINSTKGGMIALERKNDLLSKYGLTAGQVELDVENLTYEELKAELVRLHGEVADDDDDTPVVEEPEQEEAEDAKSDDETNGQTQDTDGEQESDINEDQNGDSESEDLDEPVDEEFSLMGEQFRNELLSALSEETVDSFWGETSRYVYVDYDPDASMVYAYDFEDWKLYGFSYSMNGDNVVIDFGSKSRKKFSIVDFDEGEQMPAFASIYSAMQARYTELEDELVALRQFKADADKGALDAEREKLFARFEDLAGNEAFENLRSDCDNLTVEELEEKCFAIRGRTVKVEFSMNPKAPKLKVEDAEPAMDDDPYHGVFQRYNIAE